ncbi:MAG: tRNA lysidine(34) synthetase TilS [Bacillota bacterium]|jgi:tRNA(Ile)-lysidine synthase
MAKIQHKLLQQLKNYIKTYDLIRPGEKIVIALSGGMDSVVLLHLLLSLKEEFAITLIAGHLDHGIRGEISAEESRFVKSLCAEWGIICYKEYEDIIAISGGKNIEEVAREKRYAFLREVAKKASADKIATAHHADDQAETVLLHLLRGSGSKGLGAMSPRENDLIRPLLFANKSDIIDYCQENNLEYREDKSNEDCRYLRNKIRLCLLPYLEKEYNPNIKENLCTTAEICREENAYLKALTREQYSIIKEPDGGVDKKKLSAHALAMQRLLIREAYTEAAKGRDLTFAQTEAVIKLPENGSIDLPAKITAYRRQGKIYFGSLTQKTVKDHSIYKLQVGSWHDLCDGWQYKVQILSVDEKIPMEQNKSEDSIILPFDRLDKLFFAGRRPGSRMKICGMDGHKSIKSIYQEAKISSEKRANRPILYDDGKIIWLPFLRKAVFDAQEGRRIIIYCRFTDI